MSRRKPEMHRAHLACARAAGVKVHEILINPSFDGQTWHHALETECGNIYEPSHDLKQMMTLVLKLGITLQTVDGKTWCLKYGGHGVDEVRTKNVGPELCKLVAIKHRRRRK